MNSASDAASSSFSSPSGAGSRYRLEFVTGVDPLRLYQKYRAPQQCPKEKFGWGDAKRRDHLIWERFVTSLGTQAVDTQDITCLLQRGLLIPPRGCAAIWVQEAQGLCERTDRPFMTIGIHYIGLQEDIVRRNTAAYFIRDALDSRIDQTTAFQLCHGEHYVIRDGQISMHRTNKRRTMISPAAFPSVPAVKAAITVPPKPERTTLCLKR